MSRCLEPHVCAHRTVCRKQINSKAGGPHKVKSIYKFQAIPIIVAITCVKYGKPCEWGLTTEPIAIVRTANVELKGLKLERNSYHPHPRI